MVALSFVERLLRFPPPPSSWRSFFVSHCCHTQHCCGIVSFENREDDMVSVLGSRTVILSMTVMGLVMVAGCLTLTTTPQGSGESTSSSGGGSSGQPCESVQDCPSVMLCTTMACMNGSCVSGFVPSGTECNQDKVCDGNGSCVECVDDNDCSGSHASCLNNNTCISCSDGEKNGAETNIDCGGPDCEPCMGMTCIKDSECGGGVCVDGVCCESSCTQTCKACNVPGKEGQCASLPSGTEDPGNCDTTKACSGGFGAKCLLKNGQSCADDGQCLSDNCALASNTCQP